MEDNCEIIASSLSSNPVEKNILYPIESAPLLQQEVLCLKNMKKSFGNPYLIIGLINEDPTVEQDSLTPVIEDLGKVDCVDQVIILKAKPSIEDFRSMKLDMIATFDPDHYKEFDQVIHLRNFESFEEREEIVFETEKIEINEVPELKVKRTTKFQAITASCKKKLKNIKKSVCKSPISTTTFENALSQSRFYLQKTFREWGERRERILRKWISRAGTTTSLLVKMLREVWENA